MGRGGWHWVAALLWPVRRDPDCRQLFHRRQQRWSVGFSDGAGDCRAQYRTQVERATPAPLVVPSLSGDIDFETAQLVDIYQQWNGSVVNVLVLGVMSEQLPDQLLPDDTNPDDLFPQGQGSGFVWDLDGHIVTNAHVVEGASQVQVTFSDGTVAIAEVVGEDLDSDLAVIKINPAGFNLQPVITGELDEMRVGMRVAAIGNPFGLEGTLTSGIISAIGRSISSSPSSTFPRRSRPTPPSTPAIPAARSSTKAAK